MSGKYLSLYEYLESRYANAVWIGIELVLQRSEAGASCNTTLRRAL
jgi:hypothetical protein